MASTSHQLHIKLASSSHQAHIKLSHSDSASPALGPRGHTLRSHTRRSLPRGGGREPRERRQTKGRKGNE
eukprot:2255970-Rhodomonas_salina.1